MRQQNSTQIPNWGRKSGKRRNAGFGSLWKTPPLDKYPQFQQKLGKKRLGRSIPSPRPGADLNGEKEIKNEIQDTPFPWGMAYPKENHELMSDPPSLMLPGAEWRFWMSREGSHSRERRKKNPNKQYLYISSGLEWDFLGSESKKPIKFYVNTLRNYPIKRDFKKKLK